jgi:hypothetical protein
VCCRGITDVLLPAFLTAVTAFIAMLVAVSVFFPVISVINKVVLKGEEPCGPAAQLAMERNAELERLARIKRLGEVQAHALVLLVICPQRFGLRSAGDCGGYVNSVEAEVDSVEYERAGFLDDL